MPARPRWSYCPNLPASASVQATAGGVGLEILCEHRDNTAAPGAPPLQAVLQGGLAARAAGVAAEAHTVGPFKVVHARVIRLGNICPRVIEAVEDQQLVPGQPQDDQPFLLRQGANVLGIHARVLRPVVLG